MWCACICVDCLQEELPSQQFNTWIRPLKAEVSKDRGSERLQLFAPNRFVKEWVVDKFLERISELVAELEEEGYPVLATYLNSSVKMKESHRDCRPLIDLAPSHKLTLQFVDLHAELEATRSRAAA